MPLPKWPPSCPLLSTVSIFQLIQMTLDPFTSQQEKASPGSKTAHSLATPSRSSFASADLSNFPFLDLTVLTNPPSDVRGFPGSSLIDMQSSLSSSRLTTLRTYFTGYKQIQTLTLDDAPGRGLPQCPSYTTRPFCSYSVMQWIPHVFILQTVSILTLVFVTVCGQKPQKVVAFVNPTTSFWAEMYIPWHTALQSLINSCWNND